MIKQEWMKIVEGKSIDRVGKHYLKYPNDWNAEYNMLLLDGKTCQDCRHHDKCTSMFGAKSENTKCGFHPNRFAEAVNISKGE